MGKNSNKRRWRKLVKKLHRKRRRQKLARKRDNELEEAELEKLKDPLYKSWLEQQEAIERQHQLTEENERQEQEVLWLRRELLAQKQFKIDELKRKAEEAKLESERIKQERELKLLEETRQKKREEIRLQAEKVAKEFDDIMTCMEDYLDDSTMKTPDRLSHIVETRPGEKSCVFFNKTNCCHYDHGCSFNHKRPLLAKIIIIKHFFQHPLLDLQEHEEYSRSDSELELSERDLRESYDEFCEDVWPVLEEFGSIINFRTIRNVKAHLKGHVFVEYAEKRSALKAFINLQNRYYAAKRLNVEFSNISQWRTGVCGMRSFKGLSLNRKCPKGVKCNFLHLMRNVNNKYNQPINKLDRSKRSGSQSTATVRESPIKSWNTEDSHTLTRNWRWSESPEIEKYVQENSKGDIKAEHTFSESSKNHSSNSRRSNTSHRRSKSKSPNTSRRKHSRKSRSNSRGPRHYKVQHTNPKSQKNHSSSLRRSNSSYGRSKSENESSSRSKKSRK